MNPIVTADDIASGRKAIDVVTRSGNTITVELRALSARKLAKLAKSESDPVDVMFDVALASMENLEHANESFLDSLTHASASQLATAAMALVTGLESREKKVSDPEAAPLVETHGSTCSAPS
jgi:hypothetical protein